jgi:hypothetical protein
MNRLESFFREYNNFDIEFADGSGITPSINHTNCNKIVDYLIKKFKLCEESNILDMGAGIGYLQRAFEDKNFKNIYSFEGSKKLCNMFLGNKTHLCMIDFAKQINDARLKKSFNLIVSIEVFEHQQRKNIDIFLQNIMFMSYICLCSIHVENEENEFHKTIESKQWWEDKFKFNNIEYEQITKEEFNNNTGVPWECSVYYILKDKNV